MRSAAAQIDERVPAPWLHTLQGGGVRGTLGSRLCGNSFPTQANRRGSRGRSGLRPPDHFPGSLTPHKARVPHFRPESFPEHRLSRFGSRRFRIREAEVPSCGPVSPRGVVKQKKFRANPRRGLLRCMMYGGRAWLRVSRAPEPYAPGPLPVTTTTPGRNETCGLFVPSAERKIQPPAASLVRRNTAPSGARREGGRSYRRGRRTAGRHRSSWDVGQEARRSSSNQTPKGGPRSIPQSEARRCTT